MTYNMLMGTLNPTHSLTHEFYLICLALIILKVPLNPNQPTVLHSLYYIGNQTYPLNMMFNG